MRRYLPIPLRIAQPLLSLVAHLEWLSYSLGVPAEIQSSRHRHHAKVSLQVACNLDGTGELATCLLLCPYAVGLYPKIIVTTKYTNSENETVLSSESESVVIFCPKS